MDVFSDLTIEALWKALVKLADDAPPDFTGAAVVLYDRQAFSSDCHCDLRDPAMFCGGQRPIATLGNGFVGLLRSIAVETHPCHDGFVLVNEQGDVTHVAQYFVPPIVSGLAPHSGHGTRFYSAICGSILPGVLATSVVCVNHDIFIMQAGNVVLERVAQESSVCLRSADDGVRHALWRGGDGRS